MSNDLNFSVSSQSDHETPPIKFTISGAYQLGCSGPNGETTWSEAFTAHPVMPMAAGYAMRNAFLEDDGSGKQGVNPAAVIQFLRSAIAGDDGKRRFMALVQDDEKLIRLDLLSDVMKAIVERQTDRPTGGSSLS